MGPREDSLINPEGDHDTGADSELLEGNKRTSDLRRSDLGVVHGDDHGKGTNTHTAALCFLSVNQNHFPIETQRYHVERYRCIFI